MRSSMGWQGREASGDSGLDKARSCTMPGRRKAVMALAKAVAMGALALAAPQAAWAQEPGRLVAGADRALPRVNLQVEWRMGGRSDSQRRQAGVQQGQMLLDTSGQVIGRTGIGATQVQTHMEAASVQQVRVLNGSQVKLFVGRSLPSTVWQWAWVPAAQGGQLGLGTSGAAGQGTGQGAGQAYAPQALPQTVMLDFGDGLTLKPRWPGGRASVLVDVEARSRQPAGNTGGGYEPDGQIKQVEVGSTLHVPLGEWTVVARSGSSTQRAQAGTLSTRELDQTEQQVLEIRISTP